jgi:hypothetical protein
MTAAQAIARSRSHDEIVTLDDYSESDFETLCVECDSNVLANGIWEFWANKGEEEGEDMSWRVHMPEKAS